MSSVIVISYLTKNSAKVSALTATLSKLKQLVDSSTLSKIAYLFQRFFVQQIQIFINIIDGTSCSVEQPSTAMALGTKNRTKTVSLSGSFIHRNKKQYFQVRLN